MTYYFEIEYYDKGKTYSEGDCAPSKIVVKHNYGHDEKHMILMGAISHFASMNPTAIIHGIKFTDKTK